MNPQTLEGKQQARHEAKIAAMLPQTHAERYAARNAAKLAVFQAMVLPIIEAFSDAWSAVETRWNEYQPAGMIERETDGLRLFISGNRMFFHGEMPEKASGQFEISACLPHTADRQIPHMPPKWENGTTKIRVSSAKTAAVVAREVERRLLPFSTERHAAALELVAEHDDHTRRTDDARRRVAKALNDEGGIDRNQRYRFGSHNGIQAQINSGDQIEVTARCRSAEEALKVIAVLRKAGINQ